MRAVNVGLAALHIEGAAGVLCGIRVGLALGLPGGRMTTMEPSPPTRADQVAAPSVVPGLRPSGPPASACSQRQMRASAASNRERGYSTAVASAAARRTALSYWDRWKRTGPKAA